MNWILQFVLKQFAKKSARKTGVAQLLKANDPIVQSNVRNIEIILKNMGINSKNLTSTDDVLQAMNYRNAMMDQHIKQQFKGLDLGKGIKSLEKKKDPLEWTKGWNPKIVPKDKTLLRDSPEAIAKIKAENKAAAERLRKKKLDEEPDDLASGGIARVGMFKGKLAKGFFEFVEGLFIKASNDIRQGKGLFKGLDQKQKMVQHDNLTKMVEQWQKTKQLPEGAEQYFGVDAKKVFAAAEAKAKRLGKGKNWKEKEVQAQKDEYYSKKDMEKEWAHENKLAKQKMKQEDQMIDKALSGMDERTLIKAKYPGISDDLLNKILIDDNPQRKADVMATMDEYLKLREIGKSEAEAYDIITRSFSKTPTKHASGGIAGQLHLNEGGRIGFQDRGFVGVPPVKMPDPFEEMWKKMTPEEKEMFKMRMENMKRGFEIDPSKFMSPEEMERMRIQQQIREQQRKDRGLPEGIQLLNQGGRARYVTGHAVAPPGQGGTGDIDAAMNLIAGFVPGDPLTGAQDAFLSGQNLMAAPTTQTAPEGFLSNIIQAAPQHDVSEYEAKGYSPGDIEFLRRTQIPTEAPEWYIQEQAKQKEYWDPSWGPFESESWEEMEEPAKVHMMRELGPYYEQEFTNPNAIRMPPVGPVPSEQEAREQFQAWENAARNATPQEHLSMGLHAGPGMMPPIAPPTPAQLEAERLTEMQARGIDPRMARSYQENIKLMGDPRMRGAKGGLAKILGV